MAPACGNVLISPSVFTQTSLLHNMEKDQFDINLAHFVHVYSRIVGDWKGGLNLSQVPESIRFICPGMEITEQTN